MAVPFYVSPDQIMQDKAEYARKGIAKGKSIVAMEYAGGLLLMAENPSASLNKISEIYDRIAFAGVGKYSEFENLRKIGIRYADVTGYASSRRDVTTKSLAKGYSRHHRHGLYARPEAAGSGDSGGGGGRRRGGQSDVFNVSFDGSISDRQQFAVIGGHAERIVAYLQDHYAADLSLPDALVPQPARRHGRLRAPAPTKPAPWKSAFSTDSAWAASFIAWRRPRSLRP